MAIMTMQVAAQTAYGIEADVEGYESAYSPDLITFMDFRRHHSGVWDSAALQLTVSIKVHIMLSEYMIHSTLVRLFSCSPIHSLVSIPLLEKARGEAKARHLPSFMPCRWEGSERGIRPVCSLRKLVWWLSHHCLSRSSRDDLSGG
jgi:hypothetical protein